MAGILLFCATRHKSEFSRDWLFSLRGSTCVLGVLRVLFQEFFFQMKCLKFFNELYVILKVYFSIVLLSKSESVKFSLIESVIYLFTVKSVNFH